MSLFLLRWIGYKRNWPLQDSDACHDTVLPTNCVFSVQRNHWSNQLYSCEPFKYKLNKFRAAASPRFPRTIAFNGLEQLVRIPTPRLHRCNFRFRLQFNFQSWKFRFEKKIVRWWMNLNTNKFFNNRSRFWMTREEVKLLKINLFPKSIELDTFLESFETNK